MKQKTVIAIIAFGCGLYFSTLVSVIARGNTNTALIVLALLILQLIIFIGVYSDD